MRSEMNGWTGGQYSLFRLMFGGYLLWHFAALLPWSVELFSSRGVLPRVADSPLAYAFPNVLTLYDSPWFVLAFVVAACGASILFAIGAQDRLAAVFVWYVLACLFGRNPLIANPALPFVGWMLLAHAAIKAAPYASWRARKDFDTAVEWRFPNATFVAAWVVMAVAYSYSGYTKLMSPSWIDGTAVARVLENPLSRPTELRTLLLAGPPILLKLATWSGLALELLFAPLALTGKLRPWLWTLMLGLHLALLVLVDFADLTLGMLVLHGFTFDPAWVKARKADKPEVIFYDGTCGLCHGFVRFVLAEDRDGSRFHFAPLDSNAWRSVMSKHSPMSLPDSIVVLTAEGSLLFHSTAVCQVLNGLGGLWRILGFVIALIPLPVSDWIYDRVAAHRKQIFGTKQEACPLLAPTLRKRFLRDSLAAGS
jgi:predicted DCC family thiol-disulfide oxidoreductase YuxK